MIGNAHDPKQRPGDDELPGVVGDVIRLLDRVRVGQLTAELSSDLDEILSEAVQAVESGDSSALVRVRGDLTILTMGRRFGGMDDEPSVAIDPIRLERINHLVTSLTGMASTASISTPDDRNSPADAASTSGHVTPLRRRRWWPWRRR